ncbi:MAG: MucR family transcriptional regulator [Chloroflexota bacterium]|nr:MucR family transcriptional regulator [Chloroflexota bacterium]
MRVELRYYKFEDEGREYRVLRIFDTLREARERYPYLQPDRSKDLIDTLGVWRAYRCVVLRPTPGVYVAVPWQPEPVRTRVSRAEVGREVVRPGKMAYFARPERYACHACGALVVSVGHHARWKHGLSPAEYRRRYRLPRGTPLSTPSYRHAMMMRNLRLRLDRYVWAYQFGRRLAPEARRRIVEADWQVVFGGRR